MGSVAALGVAEEGQRGLFPLGRPRGVHTGAPWLGLRASQRPVRPIARALVRRGGVAAWCDAEQRGKVEKKTEEGADTWVPHVSEGKENGRGNWRVGLRC
jgi:hypothetical protein